MSFGDLNLNIDVLSYRAASVQTLRSAFIALFSGNCAIAVTNEINILNTMDSSHAHTTEFCAGGKGYGFEF